MNNFVKYLDQFNVLSPNHSKIYDEYSSEDDQYAIKIETKIENHIVDIFLNNPRNVIMTGNAGDGKTRICRSLYERITGKTNLEWPESGIIEVEFGKGKIRIVKDLSELTDSIILRELTILQSSLQDKYSTTTFYLIAANEGKLTKFLSQNSNLSYLYEQIKERFINIEKNNAQLYLVNLQDVTSSLYAGSILKEWNQENNWTACESCRQSKKCVIYLNHKRLREEKIRSKLVEQYRLQDCLGTHITMREILIHMSYVMTGGLTCEDVINADYSMIKFHSEYVYYNNFYGTNLEDNSADEMGVINAFNKFDPGLKSVSTIDDFLLNGDLSGDKEIVSSHNKFFDSEIDMLLGYAKKVLDFYRRAEKSKILEEVSEISILDLIPKLRRKYFFEIELENKCERYELISYKYFQLYLEIFDNKSKHFQVKKDLMQGLNAAFSKKLISNQGNQLYAVNENLLVHQIFSQSQVKFDMEQQRNDIDHLPSKFFLLLGEDTRLEVRLPVFEYLYRVSKGGLLSTLKHEVDILLNTFKNDLINNSEIEEYDLSILSINEEKGDYSVRTISID
ncbi:hypothetical protein [Paenibacillus urinalis]|uniref:hypothetical protein n=1 Tax=Paenibacillus urinalis TaxID=521520 RepID=UPI00196119A8